MLIFARGRRLYTIACLATLLVAILHTIGNTVSPEPTDAEYVALDAAMHNYRVPLGLGMTPSVYDVYRGLVFTMSICLVAMAGLGLALASSKDATPRLLYRTAVVEAVSCGALTVLYAVTQITPALVSMTVVTLLFAAFLMVSQSAS